MEMDDMLTKVKSIGVDMAENLEKYNHIITPSKSAETFGKLKMLENLLEENKNNNGKLTLDQMLKHVGLSEELINMMYKVATEVKHEKKKENNKKSLKQELMELDDASLLDEYTASIYNDIAEKYAPGKKYMEDLFEYSQRTLMIREEIRKRMKTQL
jgi:hypothetical protein